MRALALEQLRPSPIGLTARVLDGGASLREPAAPLLLGPRPVQLHIVSTMVKLDLNPPSEPARIIALEASPGQAERASTGPHR